MRLVSVLLDMVYWLAKSAVAVVFVTLTVPEPVRLPVPLMTTDAPGVKVAELPTVNSDATAKLPLLETLAEDAMVRL